MKKIIDLLIYLLIFNILLCFTLLLDIYSSKNNITQTSIEKYISNNDNYNLINQILKDTNKKDLLKFIDYIELDINHSIENDKNNYTSFTIKLPQDKSFIALYKKNFDNTYTFFSLVDDLYYIDSFYFYNDFFIVEQSIRNSANSENNKKFIDVFFNKGSIYISVFKKDIYKELDSLDKDGYKTIISSSIDFLGSITPKIVYVYTYKSINTSNKIINENEVVVREVYAWNHKSNKFEITSKEILNNK